MGRKIKDTFAVLFLLATLLFVIKFNDINITVFSDEIGNKNDTQVSVIPNTDKDNLKEPMSEEMDIPSEDMTEGVLEDTTENATESTTENSTESTQEDMPEDTSESITDNTQDNTTDKLPDNNTENITETVPEYTPENIISSTTSLVEEDIYSFFQGEHGRANGQSEILMVMYLVILAAAYVVWQIYMIRYRHMKYRHGICYYMQKLLPDTIRQVLLVRLAGRI